MTKKNILLIDDDPLFGRTLQYYAKSMEVSLDCVTSVQTLTTQQLSTYQQLIIDMHLQGTTGLRYVEFVEECVGFIPTVLISSEAFHDTLLGPLPFSIQEFIPKKIGPQALLTKAIALQTWEHK